MVTPASAVSPNLPVNLTTAQNTRPVSVRTAQENEIDQLNNTPNAKRLYNAKLTGGVVGALVPLAAGTTALVMSRKILSESTKLRALMRTAITAAALVLTVPAAKIGASVSNALTVFFSTRGKTDVK